MDGGVAYNLAARTQDAYCKTQPGDDVGNRRWLEHCAGKGDLHFPGWPHGSVDWFRDHDVGFFTSSLASYIEKVELLEQIFHLCVVARSMTWLSCVTRHPGVKCCSEERAEGCTSPAAGGHPKEGLTGHQEGSRGLTSPSRQVHLRRYRTVGAIRRCLRHNVRGGSGPSESPPLQPGPPPPSKGLMIIAQQLPLETWRGLPWVCCNHGIPPSGLWLYGTPAAANVFLLCGHDSVSPHTAQGTCP